MSEPTLEPTVFDVCGPLPGVGTTLLEASAGTGKTFTVAALVTRYVAEGVADLDQMLVITFGRAASQELRERVREQLVEAERALGDPSLADPASTLLAQLLDASAEIRAERRRRLRDALAAFDTATIATTHQFCQLVLRSLGIAGDTDSGATLVESLDDLVVEVVDDLYLQRFGGLRERPPFDRDCALSLGRTAVGDPQAVLAPAADPTSAAGARVSFAADVRAEIERRKRRLGILSYDDLLSRLATVLADDAAPARQRMRDRWQIVLVDEFQDTDPVQWQVLDRAFSGHAAMVLIGDPKQAIYAFRGGDVVTYLAAARTADHQATLGTNWRSDAALVDRLQVVLRGAQLGHAEITVRDVRAERSGSRLAGAPHSAPFRVRRVPRDGFRLRRDLIAAAEAREHIARDCAADIAELLAAGAAGAATWDGQPVEAHHVAVLVSVRDHGLLVQRALHERGIAAVVAGGGQLFTTRAADEWLVLLEALEQPHRSALVRSAALTSFFGHTTRDLDDQGEALTGRVSDTLRGWSLLLRGRGVAALLEAAEERGLSARVLAVDQGERLLTDLRHLTQLLHETAVRDRLGLTALLGWVREEQRRTSATERPRRLDSDAAAVQIVTVHGSKGLQYPITYLPFAYQTFEFPTEVALFHDSGQRTLDVAGSGPGWDEHLARHRAEEAGEELRDLYVALTRAQSQVVTWWAPTANTRIGGLHRLLFGRQPGTPEVPEQVEVRDDEYAERVLGLIAELGGPSGEVAEVGAALPPSPGDSSAALSVRTFDRDVDLEWRRTSYSGLIRVEETTGAALAGEALSEPEVGELDDEPDIAEPVAADATGGAALAVDPVTSPMADLPAGAAFGSLVHAVLEHADPDATDLRLELREHAAEQLRWWPAAVTVDELADALVPMHETPLGPLAPGLTLGQIPLRDRLRELDFEFPLAGGDRQPVGGGVAPEVRLRDLAPLLRTHLVPDDPLTSYADRLEQPPLGDQALRGYLSGSIDAVLRIPTGDGSSRFVVVDYKTNLLGSPERPLTAADYAPELLAEAMLHSHYPLQAMLYSVVVHRYLRWRLPGYDPATHLGGVLYLYVRGMCGAGTPLVDGQPTGVFSWAPPASLVTAMSDLLDGSPLGSGVPG